LIDCRRTVVDNDKGDGGDGGDGGATATTTALFDIFCEIKRRVDEKVVFEQKRVR
jgi:hypothetical protein